MQPTDSATAAARSMREARLERVRRVGEAEHEQPEVGDRGADVVADDRVARARHLGHRRLEEQERGGAEAREHERLLEQPRERARQRDRQQPAGERVDGVAAVAPLAVQPRVDAVAAADRRERALAGDAADGRVGVLRDLVDLAFGGDHRRRDAKARGGQAPPAPSARSDRRTPPRPSRARPPDAPRRSAARAPTPSPWRPRASIRGRGAGVGDAGDGVGEHGVQVVHAVAPGVAAGLAGDRRRLERARHREDLGHVGEPLAQQALERLGGRQLARRGDACGEAAAAVMGARHRGQEPGAAAEVDVDHLAREPGGVGDPGHRHRARALLADELERGLEDALAGVGHGRSLTCVNHGVSLHV